MLKLVSRDLDGTLVTKIELGENINIALIQHYVSDDNFEEILDTFEENSELEN